MVTRKRQTFDNGVEGAEVLLATTQAGGGSPLHAVVKAGGGISNYRAASAVRGAMGIQCTGPLATDTVAHIMRTPALSDSISVLTAMIVGAIPTTSHPNVIETWGAPTQEGSGTAGPKVVLNTSGSLWCQSASGTVIGTGVALPAVGTKIWVAMQAIKGTTTTDGYAAFQIYDDSGTLIAERSSNATNAGTNQFREARVGLLNSAGVGKNVSFDEFMVEDSSTPLTLADLNTHPTLSLASGTQVGVGKIPLTATATDPDGSIASYAWTLTSQPAGADGFVRSPSTAAASLYADKAGQYTVQCVVTDNSGATNTKVLNVTVTDPTVAPSQPSGFLVWDSVAGDFV